jgi:hypothetical protein
MNKEQFLCDPYINKDDTLSSPEISRLGVISYIPTMSGVLLFFIFVIWFILI